MEKTKTIKELADELGVSKQTIQYHYQRLPKDKKKKDSNGKNIITSTSEKIISNKVSTKKTTTNQQRGSKEATKGNKEANDLVSALKEEISFLKSENEKVSASKDRQIENLTNLLDQQQKLTLQANNQIDSLQKQLLIETDNDTVDSENKVVKKKKHWWNF